MNRHPDSPVKVSVAFLQELDRQPAGTWIGSVKLDGFRRVADNTSGRWEYQARHTKGPAARKMPDSLVKEFEGLPWPEGLCLDTEYLGLRCVDHLKGSHSLHVFDVLTFNNTWLGNWPYCERLALLHEMYGNLFAHLIDTDADEITNIHYIPTQCNPGLVEMFEAQKQNPLSEGIVVRHKDSKLVGGFNGCKNGDRMYKIRYREVR
jgi:ATP-dependent DNA ligase